MADEKLGIDITAEDSASQVVDKLQTKVDKLEKSDPEVDITADTKGADHSVDDLQDQLSRLTRSDQVVVLALRAGAAQTELRDLATDLARIDAADPDVDVKFQRYAEVSGQLDQLETQIKAIGDADPEIAGGHVDEARTKLQGLGAEADRTKDSVHSMAGNAIGDFAATTSGVGPLGEALGQLSEVALAGEGSMKQLAVAGLGLGAVSAGILVLNAVMGHFADAAKHAAEIKAFNTKQIDDYTKAVLAAKAALDELAGKELKDPVPAGVNANIRDLSARTIELVDLWEKAGKVEGFDPVAGKIVDISTALVHAKITAEEYAEAVAGTSGQLNTYVARVRDAGLAQDTTNELIRVASEEHQKYVVANRDAADKTALFTRKNVDLANALDDTTAEMGTTALKAAALGVEMGRTRDKTKDLENAYRDLTSKFDDESAFLALEDGFAGVREALDKTKVKTDDQAGAWRNARQATLDQIDAVRDYAADVLGLPPEQITKIIADLNDGKVDEVEAELKQLTRDRQLWIDVGVRGLLGAITGISAGIGSITTTSAPAPATVNNFLARPAAAAEINRTQARYARINGR